MTLGQAGVSVARVLSGLLPIQGGAVYSLLDTTHAFVFPCKGQPSCETHWDFCTSFLRGLVYLARV